MAEALNMQYCGIPCEECPVADLHQGSQLVDLVFQASGPDLDRGATLDQIETVLEGGMPEAVVKAVARHLNSQCATSPETSINL